MKTNLRKVAGVMVGCLLAASLALAGQTLKQAKIQVKGMACSRCVARLEQPLKKIPGVAKVDVSLKKGEADVEAKSGATVTEKQLRQAVKAAGFTPGKIQSAEGDAPQTGEVKSGADAK